MLNGIVKINKMERLQELNCMVGISFNQAKMLTELLGHCLYAFLYNNCIHESSWATVSLHYSKEGAEKAMQEHKQKALDEFNEMYANDNELDFKFGEHEDWCVEPVEVFP